MSTPAAPEDVPAATPPVRSNTAKSQASISRPGNLIRKASETFSQSRPPVGMFHAFGSVGSNIPTLNDIQTGKFSQEGWSGPGQRRNSLAHRETDVEVLEVRRQRTMSIAQSPKVPIISEKKEPESSVEVASTQIEMSSVIAPHDPNIPYANGYQFPPKHTKKQAFKIAMKGSWNFVTTPFGFLLTIYALNIVAWGGMLFLILIHATPAMAHPSYNDDYSGAKIWLEITAQILNALFCVTGLGLIPWRFRDLYYLLVWRLQKKEEGLRHLAGIHRNWFRLKGSQEIDIHFDPSASSAILPEGLNESALALPISLSPDAPLTGERASASKYWMMDFVVWMFVWNTFLQIILCGFMWGYNRFKRPGAAVGALISLACIVASAAGYLVFREGKRVKKVEGVPVSEEDMKILREMREKEGASV